MGKGAQGLLVRNDPSDRALHALSNGIVIWPFVRIARRIFLELFHDRSAGQALTIPRTAADQLDDLKVPRDGFGVTKAEVGARRRQSALTSFFPEREPGLDHWRHAPQLRVKFEFGIYGRRFGT